MKFFNRFFFPVLSGVFVIAIFVSCEEEVTTLGSGVVGNPLFDTEKETFEVLASNKKIEAVQTNKLPIYQLGNFTDPLYGKTEAKIISQVQLSTVNPTFGTKSKDKEIEDGFQEKETVTDVYLNIPYLTNTIDTDKDGLVDAIDLDPKNANSDYDGDGLTDNQEKTIGTNPLNADTDGDGINDSEDPETIVNTFAKKFDLDSIYKKDVSNMQNVIGSSFNLKVKRSTYFLRDLDPETNFEQAQEYFSNEEYSSSFFTDEIFNGDVLITDTEKLVYKKDDPKTVDVDESKEVESRIAPGIRVKLNTAFFQANILDKEGASELLNQTNFKDFIRGFQLSVSDDILLLLDMKSANIVIEYSYDKLNNNDTNSDASDDVIETKNSSYELKFLTIAGNGGLVLGNAVNIFDNDPYPVKVVDSYTETDVSRIYLKGGAGSYSEIKISDDDIAQIKKNNWVINEANLVFYVDSSELGSPGNNVIEPSRLYLFNAETNAPLYNATIDIKNDEQPSKSFLEYDGILEKEGNKGVKYTIRITDYINRVLKGTIENASLGLTVTSNINSAFISNTMVNGSQVNLPLMSTVNPLGTVLFGSSTMVDEDKRLKLEISYTIVN